MIILSALANSLCILALGMAVGRTGAEALSAWTLEREAVRASRRARVYVYAALVAVLWVLGHAVWSIVSLFL